MRKILIVSLSFLFILALGCGEQFPEKFSYLPEKPQANQEITIKYNPKGTDLEKAESVEALAYQFYGAEIPVVKEVALKKKGKGWIGSFTADDSTLLIFVNFKSAEDLDNNEEAGYKIILVDTAGNDLPGTFGALAFAVYFGTYPMNIKRDAKFALEMVQKEFTLFPQNKSKFNNLYWSVLPRVDKINGESIVKAELDSIASQNVISLSDKKILANWYGRVKEIEKAEKYKTEVIEAEPAGELAQSDRFTQFRSLKNPEEKIQSYTQFVKDFPDNNYSSYMATAILRDLTTAKRFDEAENFLNENVNKPNSNLYNTIAWDMVEKEINLQTAAKLAKQGVEVARQETEAPVFEKPSYLTEAEWRKNLKMPLGMILDTYATALMKMGELEKSIPLFEESVEILKKSDNQVNERYAEVLLKTEKNQQAYDFTEGLLKEGNKTPKIEEYFKKSWLAVKGSDEGLEEFLNKIKQQGGNKLKAALKKEMMDKPAPDFSLEDLDGNTVSLTDLKGKTVILDFWATWCGPCIRAFPAMQKAVDKFKDNENVKFIFINTWERGEGVKEKVAKFIKEKNVSFHVLFDLKNEVVTAYGVEGIPTKFLVDKNGKIRFKSVGFSGDDDKLVEELSLMVEMVE